MSNRSHKKQKSKSCSKKKLQKSKSMHKVTISSSAAKKDQSTYPSTYKKSGFSNVQQHVSTIPTPKSSKNVTAV